MLAACAPNSLASHQEIWSLKREPTFAELTNPTRPRCWQTGESVLQDAHGLCPFSHAVWIKLIMTATRMPLRDEPANRHSTAQSSWPDYSRTPVIIDWYSAAI
ncbi:hypothetical protein ALP77_200119 [Pseudomonas amygdali pv. tabaci]|nr:hypothetical protein ALO60_200188 [Pseudomonas amygdali pv. tabaci]RMR89474.1 hypothetical protein ALP77_200119 [Pseudomonas amygdali pv. tabaci]